MNTVELIEVVWTAIAFVGLVFSLLAIREAERDLIVLNTLAQNGPKHVVCWGAIRREALRLVSQTLFAATGFLAMLVPHDYAPYIRLVMLASLLVGAASGVLQTVSDFFSRRALNAALERSGA